MLRNEVCENRKVRKVERSSKGHTSTLLEVSVIDRKVDSFHIEYAVSSAKCKGVPEDDSIVPSLNSSGGPDSCNAPSYSCLCIDSEMKDNINSEAEQVIINNLKMAALNFKSSPCSKTSTTTANLAEPNYRFRNRRRRGSTLCISPQTYGMLASGKDVTFLHQSNVSFLILRVSSTRTFQPGHEVHPEVQDVHSKVTSEEIPHVNVLSCDLDNAVDLQSHAIETTCVSSVSSVGSCPPSSPSCCIVESVEEDISSTFVPVESSYSFHFKCQRGARKSGVRKPKKLLGRSCDRDRSKVFGCNSGVGRKRKVADGKMPPSNIRKNFSCYPHAFWSFVETPPKKKLMANCTNNVCTSVSCNVVPSSVCCTCSVKGKCCK